MQQIQHFLTILQRRLLGGKLLRRGLPAPTCGRLAASGLLGRLKGQAPHWRDD
jgi:hypothetical protein